MFKGRTIRNLMEAGGGGGGGGGRGEVHSTYSRKEKIKWKKFMHANYA